MSLSAESLNLRRKRIATEHVMNNGDPLVVRKKARQAVQANKTVTTATVAAPAPKNTQRRTSVHMEDIEEEEDAYPRNVAPLNPSRLLELSDGSDDEGTRDVIEVYDNSEDGYEEPEESAEAELGQSLL
jgi:hypothetical protein